MKLPILNLSSLRSTFPLALLALFAARPASAAMSRGFNQILNAVVRIDVRELDLEDGTQHFDASIGSGVVLSADGLVLTNAHVASPEAVEIKVTLASLESVGARLVGWDHWTDLALLRLDMNDVRRRGLKFAHAEFGDSDKLYPGEVVYAVGTPYGLNRTVTRGIISNTRCYLKDDRGVDGYETGAFNTWLQTDAAINPGNSGGPLVTEDGRVVGITSRSYLGANNLGFAIPINVAKVVVADLVRDGSITRSYIGLVPGVLEGLEKFYSLGLDNGMLIDSVDPHSPAEAAGLRAGDVLLAINGRKVDARFPEQIPPIQNYIASQPVGTLLRLTVKDGVAVRDVVVATTRLESSVGEERAFESWGLSVRKISRTYAMENELDNDVGVLVIGVRSGYPADVAGLEPGDIITRIDRNPVTSLKVMEAAHAIYTAKPRPILLEAERDRRVSLYIIKP